MKKGKKFSRVMEACEQELGEPLYTLSDILNYKSVFNLNGDFDADYFREELKDSTVNLNSLGVDLTNITIRTAYKSSGVQSLFVSLGATNSQLSLLKPSYKD